MLHRMEAKRPLPKKRKSEIRKRRVGLSRTTTLPFWTRSKKRVKVRKHKPRLRPTKEKRRKQKGKENLLPRKRETKRRRIKGVLKEELPPV